MRIFRLFVSSPGDADVERRRTENVVSRLNGEFAGLARIEAVRWETEYYQAHTTFQTQISEASECDIVVGSCAGGSAPNCRRLFPDDCLAMNLTRRARHRPCARRHQRFRSRTAGSRSRSPVRCVLHDQRQRPRHGIVDLPLDHRCAWRAAVGRAEPTPRRDVLHDASDPDRLTRGFRLQPAG